MRKTAGISTSTILASLVLISAGLAQGNSDPEVERARTAIDKYMDQRWLPPAQLAGTTQVVMRRIAAARLDIAAVEDLMRRGRRGYPGHPKEILTPGRFTHYLHPLQCEHVDYATSYLLHVPRSYKPGSPASLVIVAHGGNGSMLLLRAGTAAYHGTLAFVREAERHNFILAAPITQRGWGHIGNSVVFSLISELTRRYHIDPDRIYVTGHSMGGHMSWRSALAFPDRWGAVAPMSGGYDYVKNEAIYSLFNVPGYATYCTREPYGIDRDNKINGMWLKQQGFDWISVQGRGSHTILPSEVPKVARFFQEHPRDLYPKQVYARASGELLVDTAPDPEASVKRGWPRTEGYAGPHTWNRERPLDRSIFYWVRLTPRRPAFTIEEDATGKETRKPIRQTVFAENKGDNRIELTSENARIVVIYLHPKMVDLSKPITIIANSKTVFASKVEADVFTMLNVAREFDDRGRIYHASVAVKIADDRVVEIPKRAPK